MSKKPKFEDTLPLDEEVISKPSFEDTLPIEEEDEVSVASEVQPQIAEGDIYDTLADVAVTAPQGITTWADEAQAALKTALRVGGGEKASLGEVFDDEVGGVRQRIALARERSPFATTAGEIGTGIGTAFVPGAGFGKLAGAGSMIARGAIEGAGTAEDKTNLEDLAIQSGIGGGLGALGSLVSGGLKKLTTADPNKIRANVLGARTSEFKEIGIKERENIAKELKDMGLFSNTKVEFDVDQGKFISKGKSLENLEKPATEKLLERLDSATSKIQEEKLKILGKFADDFVNMRAIDSAMEEVAYKFSKKATNKEERLKDALELKETILADIWDDVEMAGADIPTIGMIEAAKKRLSDDVSNIGKNPLLSKTPYTADLYNKYYSAINKELRKLLGDSKYSNFNDMQQKMLTAKADLTKAIASEDAQRTQAGWGGWFNKIANETLGSPDAGLGMASTKEAIDRVLPQGVQRAGKLLVEESPFAAMRYIDPSIPKAEIPFAPEEQNSSMFQGVRPAFPFGVSPEEQIKKLPGSSMISPKQLIKYRIPRSSDAILQNKELVLAKIAQAGVPSEMYDTIAYALNESPEQLPNIAPLVMTQFPTLFEQSKYKTFDGMIIDPNDKARMADDISKRDDIDSIQRAKMISTINKTGKVPEGMV